MACNDGREPKPDEIEFSWDKIWDWNRNVSATIAECIHDQIINLARIHPERPAVTSWDGSLTYGQLDNYSAVLASYLLQRGAGAGKIIPLCFNKSIWSIVSLLGVLRSGSTVTMTDPSQPEQRLAIIAEEVNAKLVVTSAACERTGQAFAPQAHIVAIDHEFFDKNSTNDDISLPPVSPDQTMYVIFTSGSTGKPKGVMISHTNFTSGAIPRAKAVGYRPHSRVLDFPSYAFDVSYDCMLCTLANGGCICVPSDHQRINDLSDAIRSMKVNMAHMTPSVARLLDDDIVPSLEVLGVGGEPLALRDTSSWTATTKVVNAYGPSECTVGCTINNSITPDTSYITIGKGCGGCTWVCDPADHDKLAPYGEVGELLIEGPIVGQGYLDNIEKTREVFIENPTWLTAGFGRHAGRGGRLYKTGDLVKYDNHGALIFVGRKDQQVKIRGQRVELGEIEHHLRTGLPQGYSITAEVIKPNGTEPVLVAFLADRTATSTDLETDTMPLSSELIAHLQTIRVNLESNLPIYMVPTAYVLLRVMPLLVSLKVDRKKLQQIGAKLSRRDLAAYSISSMTRRVANREIESQLRKCWDVVFGTDTRQEGIDHFFALGGDSLKAMKLVSITKEHGLALSVAQILQNPVLADMASVTKYVDDVDITSIKEFSMLPSGLTDQSARCIAAKLCDVSQEQIGDVYPCTPLQEGLMALSSKIPEAYVSQRVVKLPNSDVAERLRSAFKNAEQHCEILRTRIIQVTEYGLLQVVLKDGEEWVYASDLEQYLTEDRNKHMELAKPLVRYAIVEDSSNGGLSFVLTMHHALYDGWSMPLVVNLVNRAYHHQTLPQIPSFKLFINHLCSADAKDSEQYWKTNLEGIHALQFPSNPEPSHQAKSDSLLEHYISWDRDNKVGTSLANVIRGAWALVASDYCGSDDVVIGETLTGRNAPIHGIEQIVAPLITTVPLRIKIARELTTAEYLQDVQTLSIERISHEHLGLQNIRRLSKDARNACDLRTGLVIHPRIDEDAEPTEKSPANDLMPAGDIEAAKEALKFNSYNLMLVCTQDENGFLTMASFDSRTVSVETMKQALHRFESAVHFLTEKSKQLKEYEACNNEELSNLTSAIPGSIQNVPVKDLTEAQRAFFDASNAFWIVSSDDMSRILPRGAIGELILERQSGCSGGESLANPLDIVLRGRSSSKSQLYRSNYLARSEDDGSIKILGLAEKLRQSGSERSKSSKARHDSEPAELDETGKLLRQCWSRLLKIDENEIHQQDNFFELGGDSIIAMRLVSDLRARGCTLTVANIFTNDRFSDMAQVIQISQAEQTLRQEYTPFASLNHDNKQPITAEQLKTLISNPSCRIIDAYPVRPLQTIAIDGTVNLPRFSIRYELFHFDSKVDKEKLFGACRHLIDANEILRTTFVANNGSYIGIVVQDYPVDIDQYDIDGDLGSFCSRLCDLDALRKIQLGSQFVKFFYVREESSGKSSLIMRISHAQYDEVCLPDMLHQFVQFYKSQSPLKAIPFSRYVNQIVNGNNQNTVSYWKDLLQGSAMTILKPDTTIASRRHFAISRKFDISRRPKAITVATLPTAAWALCLSRKLSLRDVTFGEVVDGRNIDFEDAEKVMGPCWQYIPVRVKFEPHWTSADLFSFIQRQHAQSGRHASMGLEEIVEQCTDWSRDTTWFDTVVHQDVAHAETFEFDSANCKMETIYPHEEPLREWKVQAFHDGDNLTIEVVTFESWKEEAETLLGEIGECLLDLVNQPDRQLFSSDGHD